MRIRHLLALVVASVFVAACSPDNPTSPEAAKPEFLIVDGAHAGNPHFYFLPPMVRAPSYSGAFDPSLTPTVRISEGLTIVADLVATAPAGTELYQAEWHTDQYNLDPARTYRISIRVDGVELGFADVDVVSSGNQLKNVNTGEYIALQNGRTLPIKFRIENGALPVLPILFLHDVGNANEDIYSIMPDGSGLTRITNEPGRDYAPRWSPDRTRIAFSSERWCGGCGIAPELYIANPDGSGAVQVTHGLYSIYGVTWSPDGSRFAIESQGGTYLPSETSIYTLNLDGSGVARLTSPRTFKPDWSPDGNRILFETYTPVGISVMNADGSGFQQLRSVTADNRGATWSPDGGRIAYGDQDHIWVMSADGSGATQLTSGPWIDGSPVWSPDGRFIAFASNRSGVFQIHAMRSDGSQVQQVTHVTEGRAVEPAWR